jgi:hypothetical protein
VSLFRTRLSVLAMVMPILILGAGCEDRDPMDLDIARANTDRLVFDDAYSPDIYFQPFFETHYTAVTVDSVFAFGDLATYGGRSLKVEIAPAGSALGAFSGGVLTPSGGRDLADYNALTFYVRANVDTLSNGEPISLDTVGFGNDNTGTSRYEVSRSNPFGIPLTRDWTYHIVPIPDASKLISERGLFLFSEGPEPDYPDGHDIWFDEIRFAKVDGLAVQGSGFTTREVRRYFTGMTVGTGGAVTAFGYEGGQIRLNHSSLYYDLLSSNTSAATTDRWGNVHIIGEGETEITGQLRNVDVSGRVSMATYEPPEVAAESPPHPASDVISLFSEAYDDVPVDKWKADWEGVTTQVQDFEVAGQQTKMYYDLNWVGIELLDQPVDASQMTHFHLDVYAPAGTQIIVGLESFSAGMATSEGASVTLNATSTPPFVAGSWSCLDIPMADFPTSETWNWGRIGIVSLARGTSAELQLLLVDNIYWHK